MLGGESMNYPNGKKQTNSWSGTSPSKDKAYSNRGMTLEEDINITNSFYLDSSIAVIHKKPTPIQIVKVNYPKRSAAVITEGYFKQASTTDYNGVYLGKHIDFEAKETKNKTRFPLANIHDHQLDHMRSIVKHGGISFLLIRFTQLNETYFFPAEKLFSYWDDKFSGERKSIPHQIIKRDGYLIPFHYQKRIDYLAIIDKLYF